MSKRFLIKQRNSIYSYQTTYYTKVSLLTTLSEKLHVKYCHHFYTLFDIEFFIDKASKVVGIALS